MWNGGREAARDASLGQEDLATVAGKLLTYLQAAEPTAFGQGHKTAMKAPVITLPAKTTGYTCWDTTANKELFTVTFKDCTDPDISDPTGMKHLDRFEIGVLVPYTSIGWVPVAQVTAGGRLSAKVYWAAMVDSPFEIAPYLPAQ
jgi:hypothetical protein